LRLSRRKATHGEKNSLAASVSAEPWVNANKREDDPLQCADTFYWIELSCFEQKRSSWGTIIILHDEDEDDEHYDEMRASHSV
jgi:hypothetical protein